MTATDVDGWWRGAAWADAAIARPSVVAFQGERGAYGDLAIEMLWGTPGGGGPLRERCWDFDGVIRAVTRGCADAAVLPVHNVIVGEIPGVADAIARAGLRQAGEVTVPVRHCLLAAAGASLSTITSVWSHPVALAQCGAFLDRHPAITARETYDTAGAAREVSARRLRHEAAIAPEGCAARYGLSVVARDVGDRVDNATRFVVVVRGR